MLALYNGTWDAAHISFVHEANDWFPRQAAQNGFTCTASDNWELLAGGGVDGYRVVLFLDDRPSPPPNAPDSSATCGVAAPGRASTSSVSEWYGWSNDLRRNPDTRILASVDPRSYPLGTDPDQSWYSGYYPILWTNAKYRMLYADFGHNAMDYATNTLSSTFASETQNRFLLDGLKWLGHTVSSHVHANS